MVRDGVRVARRTLVVHALPRSVPPSRAGFVVSRAVGNAVTRNRVKRQLRHLVADVLPREAPSLDVVVRALPEASRGALAEDFRLAWSVALRRVGTAA